MANKIKTAVLRKKVSPVFGSEKRIYHVSNPVDIRGEKYHFLCLEKIKSKDSGVSTEICIMKGSSGKRKPYEIIHNCACDTSALDFIGYQLV